MPTIVRLFPYLIDFELIAPSLISPSPIYRNAASMVTSMTTTAAAGTSTAVVTAAGNDANAVVIGSGNGNEVADGGGGNTGTVRRGCSS